MRSLAGAVTLLAALALVRGDRVALAAGQASSGQAAKPAAAPEAPPSVDGTWPREVKTSIGVVTVYQPQPEDWDGSKLSFRAAVSAKATAEPRVARYPRPI